MEEQVAHPLADVDIEGAVSLLEGATPTVRILYNRDNPNRVRAFELVRDSAALAGIRVLDAGQGSADWAQALGGGTYDAAILGWISTGVGVGRVPQIFRTGAGSNFNAFSDGDADRLKGHSEIQEFYLGQSGGAERRSYRDVKQYRRSRRWYG